MFPHNIVFVKRLFFVTFAVLDDVSLEVICAICFMYFFEKEKFSGMMKVTHAIKRFICSTHRTLL